MSGIDVAQVIERLFGAQFRQQNSVGFHPQAGFQQLLGRDAGNALIVFGIKQADMIRMPIQHQFLRIFDGHQPLVAGYLPNQCFGPSGFSGAGRPRDHDVLAATYRQPHEGLEIASLQQSQEFLFDGVEHFARRLGTAKYSAARQFLDAPNLFRRPADG